MIYQTVTIRPRQLHLSSWLLLLMFVTAFGYGRTDAAQEADNPRDAIIVYAASGLMTAVEQIVERYEATEKSQVTVSYASSSTLARQIQSGASFDVFISANEKWIDYVQQHGRICHASRRQVTSDSLVLIAPAGNADQYTGMTLAEILDNTTGMIALGDWSHVPCGQYTKQALVNMGRWEILQNRLLPAASVRAAQQYAEINQCQFAIVYRAGALQSAKIKIIAEFDDALHASIRFIAACATDSKAGQSFTQYLMESDAQTIFKTSGYSHIDPTTDGVATSRAGSFLQQNHRSDQRDAVKLSLKVATVCTLVLAVPGILMGYFLAGRTFPGCSIVNAIIHLPMVIPPVVTGYLALAVLGRNSLVGQWLNDTFGITISFTWWGAVFVSAIMGLPLLVRSVKTAVEMVDSRYALAASTLGSGPIRTFVTVTLPLAAPGILAGLFLAFARSLGEFGATITFAGNIPGKTQTLSLAIYNFTQIPGGESSAMHLVLISVILCFIAMLGSELLSRKMKYLIRTNQ